MKIATLLIALLLLAGCAADPPEASRQPQLLAVPVPDFTGVEDDVRERLEESRTQLDAVLANGLAGGELGLRFAEQGKIYQAHGFDEEAEICFVNARQLLPREARWPFHLGHIYRGTGDRTLAAENFARALELAPDYLPTYIALAQVYLEEDRPDDAEPLLLAALERQPDLAPALYRLGRVAAMRGQHEEAVRLYEEALALAPRASEIHYPLGLAYRALGDLDRARRFLEDRGTGKTPLADPWLAELGDLASGARLYQNRGNTALAAGRFEEAAAAFRQAVEADPDSAGARVNLAAALSRLGDLKGARDATEEALGLDPDHALANFGMGTLMARIGRDGDAITYYERALVAESDHKGTHINLANALLRQGRLADAEEHYARVVTLDPRAWQAHLGQAVVQARQDRWAESGASLERAYDAQPEVAPLADALARFLAACPIDELRDGDRALEIAQSLVAKERSLRHTEALAMALAEVGRHDEAVKEQQAAIGAAKSAGRNDLVARLARNLANYLRRQPCREPWADDVQAFPAAAPETASLHSEQAR